MRSRTLATLAVASMLLLAGCSFGGSGSPTPTDGSVTGTATDSPTATPAGQSFSYPAGYESDGVANATAAAAAHREAMLATSGFTVRYDATVVTPNATSYVTYDQRVETESREVVRRTNVTTGGLTGLVVRYYDGNTVYVKSDQPGSNETSYGNQSQQYDLRAFTGAEFVRPALSQVTYGSSEVRTRDGTDVVVYSDATMQSTEGLFGRGISAENVTEFSATLVVDGDGRVHELRYSATITRANGERSVDVTVTTTGVGGTTVAAPDWVSNA